MFDVAHVTDDARGGEWLDWVAERHPHHFEAVLATICPSHIPEYSAYGPRRENLKERIEAAHAAIRNELRDWLPDGQVMMTPAVTLSAWPVMAEESSHARNRVT